ncbi:hypothetical protein AVEN_41027-1 [Araneus ventricosus]|uniref:PiggyBac transposable element-derived protein domain-containing protein n=1 Tax=Araneus ventricosus TaxID=182803 RepID=A0A4Y2CJ53_ARAVE|nr:hypothetical protein AVEN_41027-1 [Araneus ventricosus]
MPFNKIAAVRWIDNRDVSLITNFDDKSGVKKVERRMKGRKQKIDIPLCVVSCNLYKNGVDLLDNLIKTYFSSMQEKSDTLPTCTDVIYETTLPENQDKREDMGVEHAPKSETDKFRKIPEMDGSQ